NPSATVFHIDVDPLKQQMPVFYLDAVARYRADSFQALSQLHSYITSTSELREKTEHISPSKRQENYQKRLQYIRGLVKPGNEGTFETPYLINRLRHFCPKDTIWCIEAVTETVSVADQIQATQPGSWINCGGGGLGWSGGASLGIKLAAGDKKFVCQI